MPRYDTPKYVVATKRGFYDGSVREPESLPFPITHSEHFANQHDDGTDTAWMRPATARDMQKLAASQHDPFAGPVSRPVGPEPVAYDPDPLNVKNPGNTAPVPSRRAPAPRQEKVETLTDEELEQAQYDQTGDDPDAEFNPEQAARDAAAAKATQDAAKAPPTPAPRKARNVVGVAGNQS